MCFSIIGLGFMQGESGFLDTARLFRRILLGRWFTQLPEPAMFAANFGFRRFSATLQAHERPGISASGACQSLFGAISE